MMHLYVVAKGWAHSGDEPEPLGEVDYATLPPHVGITTGPKQIHGADAS